MFSAAGRSWQICSLYVLCVTGVSSSVGHMCAWFAFLRSMSGRSETLVSANRRAATSAAAHASSLEPTYASYYYRADLSRLPDHVSSFFFFRFWIHTMFAKPSGGEGLGEVG